VTHRAIRIDGSNLGTSPQRRSPDCGRGPKIACARRSRLRLLLAPTVPHCCDIALPSVARNMRYDMAVDKADLGFLVGSNRCVSRDVSSLSLSVTMLLLAFARADDAEALNWCLVAAKSCIVPASPWRQKSSVHRGVEVILYHKNYGLRAIVKARGHPRAQALAHSLVVSRTAPPPAGGSAPKGPA
jgi:hypothetical protein